MNNEKLMEFILKAEPLQGPMMNEEMLQGLNQKEFEKMKRGLMEMTDAFSKNAKYLKQLVGQEEAQEVVGGIVTALRIYGNYLQDGVGDSTDAGFSPKESAKGREYLRGRAKEFHDLADDLMQSIR
jgi:predicted DNA-binding protein (UPF0278 family)